MHSVAGMLSLVLVLGVLLFPEPAEREFPSIAVELRGDVSAPGFYLLPEGSRMSDALALAGIDRDDKRVVENGTVLWMGESHPPARFSSPLSFGLPVTVNAASEASLVALPGIGPARAAAIKAYREKNGPFQTMDGLMKVRGIGPVTLAKIAPYISVAP